MAGDTKPKRHYSIPAELLEKRRWVCWALRYVERKTPAGLLRQPRVIAFRPLPDRAIPLSNVTNPDAWATFDQAVQAAKRNPELNGPAFVNVLGGGLEEETYVMVVLHNAVDASTKEIAPWAAQYLALAETYAEYGFAPRSLVLLFRGKRFREPLRYGSIYVYSPPFLALTGRRLHSAPRYIRGVWEKVRPRDEKSRFERILEIAEESYRRYRERRRTPRDRMREVLGQVSTRLGALHTLGTNMYAATCPDDKPGTLILHWQGPRLHIGCVEGPRREPKELAELLGIEYDPENILPLEPALVPHYQSLVSRLLTSAQPQYPPVRGHPLRLIQRYQQALRTYKRVPEALEGTPLTYEDVYRAGMGYNPNHGGAVYVFYDPEGRIIHAVEHRRTRAGRLQQIVLTPHQQAPSWLAPDYARRTEGVLIVEGLPDAVLLNSLLLPNSVAVVGVPSIYHDPVEEFLRALPPTNAYLYPGPENEEARSQVAARWARIAAQAGHTPFLLDLLHDESGQPVSMLRYAAKHSRTGLLEALVNLTETARNPLVQSPAHAATGEL